MADIFESINAIREAVIAIQKELGIKPSKIYANVRARLDILENRINNPSTSTPSVDNPFIIGTSGTTISSGTGEPTSLESSGSLYLRSDGQTYEGLYARRGTAWQNISNYTDNYLMFGEASSGAEIDLRLSDNSKIVLDTDGTYTCTFKTIIESTSGAEARAYFENVVFLHVSSSAITIDSDTQPLQITNGTSYNVNIVASGNTIQSKIDAEGSDDRRAQSIVEVQKLI